MVKTQTILPRGIFSKSVVGIYKFIFRWEEGDSSHQREWFLLGGGAMTRPEKIMVIGMYIAASADVVVAVGVMVLLLR